MFSFFSVTRVWFYCKHNEHCSLIVACNEPKKKRTQEKLVDTLQTKREHVEVQRERSVDFFLCLALKYLGFCLHFLLFFCCFSCILFNWYSYIDKAVSTPWKQCVCLGLIGWPLFSDRKVLCCFSLFAFFRM